MPRQKEKNIQQFNADIKAGGRYQYTNFDKFSAYVATKRQTDELIGFIKQYNPSVKSILDVGCGDGTFTFEIFELVKPKKIVGFDSAKSAIRVANKTVKKIDKKKITFLTCNVYNTNKEFKKNSFELIVIRGVLHHLYNPEEAIQSLSHISNNIIVLEPNGYNPILKIIEKVSPYHRKHEERSYYPPLMNTWFTKNGYKIKRQIFFSIVPYFCPEIVAKMLKLIEPFIESIPLIKRYFAGTNLIYYQRKKLPNNVKSN
jgi:ubiquinone/menaquinone biosynthesis C-methylase UbiE